MSLLALYNQFSCRPKLSRYQLANSITGQHELFKGGSLYSVSSQPEPVEGASLHSISCQPGLVEGGSLYSVSSQPEPVEGASLHSTSCQPELVEVRSIYSTSRQFEPEGGSCSKTNRPGLSFHHYPKSLSFFFFLLICFVSSSFKPGISNTGTLKITFINTANGKAITLRDSLYKNPFGEEYSINKLKYYISNFSVPGSNVVSETDPYHLINAAEGNNNSFEVSLSPGNYKNINFLLGVDSIRNCSGAQTGALDASNDMFWTWNSGYVMLKFEGNSTASKSDLQRIEHHIGGYKGSNSVITKITLDFSDAQLLQIKKNETTELVIETNLDHYWNTKSEIKISETPLCTTSGELAKKIASNFTGLFSVKSMN